MTKLLQAFLLCGFLAFNAYAVQATISSDELELQNNADITIFTGHVILKQMPYEIHADRMDRAKATGLVQAKGHVVATWVSAKGEHLRLEGEEARYDPVAHTVDLWGTEQVSISVVQVDKGVVTFQGDRGWVSTSTPGQAKLIGRVTGHVSPAS